jgi:V-type H+-transporting ATPase subunit C
VIIQDSEYLETHLVAVPAQLTRDFLKMYETISPWVVPQSAQKITFDDEFTLFAATSFKKYSPEFIHKCREQRWIPRDFKFKEGGKEEEKKELESAEREERKLWGQALALGKTGWSDAVQAWVHVLALQVFVETVLRYGLPLSFVCGLVKVCRFLAREQIQMANTELTDNPKVGKENSNSTRRIIFIFRWECTWPRQER